jgi:hypothetical protein
VRRGRFSSERRAEIATAWLQSNLDQVAFCKEVGVSPRALRNWLRLVPGPKWSPRLEQAVRAATTALANVLLAMGSSAPAQDVAAPVTQTPNEETPTATTKSNPETVAARPPMSPTLSPQAPGPVRNVTLGGAVGNGFVFSRR